MTEQNKKYFHFTLGPVQSFVGQARRTRDFWAGSFLLSWLSGVAMQSAIAQGGTVLFPKADQDFLNAINGKGNNKPKQGSIPNRFKVEVDESFNPSLVLENVQQAWQALADDIYAEIEPFALENTKSIWQRQVASFWEMSWVLVDNKSNSSGLDCRKNWRSQYLPDEPGIKCSLMGDWQELSGVEGVFSQDRKAREAFWQQIKVNAKNKHDFVEKEMLCAMSYIKRRFLTYFSTFKAELNGFTAYGWELPQAIPSVSYISAANWFSEVLQKASLLDVEEFSNQSKKLFGNTEYGSDIKCIRSHCQNRKLSAVDGNAFYEITLDNNNIVDDPAQAKKVKQALKKLTNDFGPISPFYAVLMMDGDSLGKQMSDINKQDKITAGLAEFTQKVPEIVYNHNGFLVYAGGDDVLALVTLEDAMSCALAVRTHYQDCFKNKNIETSISAAIIYTHINSPLKNILHESHQLLDDVAKDGAGRDAIAVRVYKGSGISSEWAKKWDEALDEVNAHSLVIDKLAKKFQLKTEEAKFSNGFFYKIRERFELLYGKDKAQQAKNPLSEEQSIQLMAMEYMRSLEDTKMKIETAEAIVRPLMKQCVNAAYDNKITADAALLLRFLAQKGIEGGR